MVSNSEFIKGGTSLLCVHACMHFSVFIILLLLLFIILLLLLLLLYAYYMPTCIFMYAYMYFYIFKWAMTQKVNFIDFKKLLIFPILSLSEIMMYSIKLSL